MLVSMTFLSIMYSCKRSDNSIYFYSEIRDTIAPVILTSVPTPNFNYSYGDGLQMVTLGGLIEHPDSAVRLQESGIYDLDFITAAPKPIQISVPPMTLKEKSWLEQKLVGVPKDTQPRLAFEARADLIDNFIRYYRHYPTYYETLM